MALIYEQTFETTAPLSTGLSNIHQGNPNAITRSTEQAYQGTHSGRFELNDTDPLNNNGTRCEFKFEDETEYNQERWYSFAVYFPSADYVYDNEPEIITQWHQGGGVSPCHSLETYLDRFRFIVRSAPDVDPKYDLGPIPKDQWVLFVFHIKHRDDSQGLIEIFMNGALVKTIPGDNSYNPTEVPNSHPVGWKIGLYKWDWNGTATSLTSRRVMYYDNIRIGDEDSSYTEITGGVPASTTTTTTIATTSTTTTTTQPPTWGIPFGRYRGRKINVQ